MRALGTVGEINLVQEDTLAVNREEGPTYTRLSEAYVSASELAVAVPEEREREREIEAGVLYLV